MVTTYGADLEVFVEKSFGDSFTLRFVGSNLLNAKKEEAFSKFALLSNQIGGSIDDEYELEVGRGRPGLPDHRPLLVLALPPLFGGTCKRLRSW